MALSHKDMYTITVNVSLAVVGSARPHPPSVGVPESARRCIYLRQELTLVVQLDVQLSSQFINLHKNEMGWGISRVIAGWSGVGWGGVWSGVEWGGERA